MAVTIIPSETLNGLTTLLGTNGSDVFSVENDNIFVEGLGDIDKVDVISSAQNLKINTGLDNDIVSLLAEVLTSKLTLGDNHDFVSIEDFTGSIYGGSGNDTIAATRSRSLIDSLIRGEGGRDDFNFDFVEDSIINMNSDDDIIVISGIISNSQIYGGRQQDVISIEDKAVKSVIRGDANDDTIQINGDLQNTIINGNADNDKLIIKSNNIQSSTVFGGKGDDDIEINSAAVYVNAGKDGDIINLLSNHMHTVYGGSGSDTINSSSTKSILINGGSEKDTIQLTGTPSGETIHTIDGGEGGDMITGTVGEELIDGGTKNSGDDTLISGGGNDSIYGRAGQDLIDIVAGVNEGKVLVHAGADDDVITINFNELTKNDTIKGEKGTDTLAVVGTSTEFKMFIPNTIEAKAFDSISGIETLAFGTTDSSYTISSTKKIELAKAVQKAGISKIDASKSSGFGDDVLEVDAFQFSSGTSLTFIGSDDKDVNVKFTGGSGNDIFNTGSINEDAGDTLTGGPGVDTFNIIATNNTAVITDLGVGGNDVFVIADTASGVTATVKADYTATVHTQNNKDSAANVILNAENGVDIDMSEAAGKYGFTINGGEAESLLRGSNFNDIITGKQRDDILIGNGGNDSFTGGGGADTFWPYKGNDQIEDAGNGNDVIIYDRGTSIIIKNTGSDAITVTASRPNAFVVATNAGTRTADASSSTSGVTFYGSGAGANKVTYTGGIGDDTIQGGLAGDLLIGNAGNDQFTGGLSADTISVGDGANTVIFTSGLSIDQITNFTSDDIGAIDLSELEADDAVVNAELDFVNADGTSIYAGEAINMQSVTNATTLQSETNILNYTVGAVADAAALETALEDSGGIVTTDAALARYDAFVIQYKDSNTNMYSYAVAHLEANVAADTAISAWEITDLATTDLATAFGSAQFSFIA